MEKVKIWYVMKKVLGIYGKILIIQSIMLISNCMYNNIYALTVNVQKQYLKLKFKTYLQISLLKIPMWLTEFVIHLAIRTYFSRIKKRGNNN